MLRVRAWTLVLAALALAAISMSACGKSKPVDPAAEALSYLPPDPALAVTLETSEATLSRVASVLEPVAAFRILRDEVKSDLAAEQFDRDYKPWMGNPAFFAFPDASSSNDDQYVAAIVATDTKALSDTLSRWVKEGRAVKEADLDGQSVYRDPDSGLLATQRGSAFVAATTRPLLQAAVERGKAKTGMTTAGFAKKLSGLPANAPAAFVGSMPQMLDSAETPEGRAQVAQARRIPWIAAMRGVAGAFTVQGSDVRFDITVDTTGRQLTEAQLPLASGSASSTSGVDSPQGSSEAVRVTDYSHIQEFSLETAKSIDPAGYGKFASSIDLIGRQLGVDIQQDIMNQFTGDTVLSFSPTGVAVVAEVALPGEFDKALKGLQPVLGAFLEGAGLPGIKVSHDGGGYAVSRDGRLVARFAVIGQSFVVTVGDETPTRAASAQSVGRATPPGAIVTWIDPMADFGLAAQIVGATGSPAVAVESLEALTSIASGIRTDPASTGITVTATVKSQASASDAGQQTSTSSSGETTGASE